jgi:hypothetical protein
MWIGQNFSYYFIDFVFTEALPLCGGQAFSRHATFASTLVKERNMRKLLTALLLCACTTVANAKHHHTPPPLALPSSRFATYYVSPTGNDTNAGTYAAPWASPNHNINCGDNIVVQAGNYVNTFGAGQWGIVQNCPSSTGSQFAQVQCAGPSVTACSFSQTAAGSYNPAIWIDQSNWAVIGGTYTVSAGTNGACILVGPAPGAHGGTAYNIHHIAVINTVNVNCDWNGINATNQSATTGHGADYVAIVGNIVYHSTQSNGLNCVEGIDLYRAFNWDNNAGTHYFIAGNIVWSNKNTCTGSHYDGNGIEWDRPDDNAYNGQVVIEQNLLIGNDGEGIASYTSSNSPVYIFNNTSWGNFQGSSYAASTGEIGVNITTHASVFSNLAQATVQTTSGEKKYGCWVNQGDSTDSVTNNFCFGVAGQNEYTSGSPTFAFGSNQRVSPGFAAPATPGAPNCSSSATTIQCMQQTINNFVPSASGSSGLGYRAPGSCKSDPYFPTWLNGIIPNGLITKPCGA